MSSGKKEKHHSLTIADCNAVSKYVQQVLKTGVCHDPIDISEDRIVKAIPLGEGHVGEMHIDSSSSSTLSGRDFNDIVRRRVIKGLDVRANNGARLRITSESRTNVASVLSSASAITTRSSVPPRPTRSSVPPTQF